MVPDRGFTKQLKKLDPDYEVVWDWGSARWEIWKFPKDTQAPYHITTVMAEGRSFRELGSDILLELQRTMPDKYGAKEILGYLEEAEKQEERRRAKAFRDKIDAIARETFDYIHVLKGRPIEKPKGQRIGEVVHA